MKYKHKEKNTTESTENLIVLKKEKTRRTQRGTKTFVYSVVKKF